MKKIVYFMLILGMIAALSGCLSSSESADKTETKIKTDEGAIEMKTETSGGGGSGRIETKIETEEGEQKVVITGNLDELSDEWCPEGGDWSMQATGVEGEASATWKVDKLVATGKYAGLCHVIYTAKTSEGEMKMEYWFDESGTRGFYEMDINGQKMSQQWTG